MLRKYITIIVCAVVLCCSCQRQVEKSQAEIQAETKEGLKILFADPRMRAILAYEVGVIENAKRSEKSLIKLPRENE